MKISLQGVLWAYLLTVNILAFSLFWSDKRRSENQLWRVPEQTLLSVAFWGGSLGALIGQQYLRHKTRKQPFRSRLIWLAAFHVVLVSALAHPISRQCILNLSPDLISRQ